MRSAASGFDPGDCRACGEMSLVIMTLQKSRQAILSAHATGSNQSADHLCRISGTLRKANGRATTGSGYVSEGDSQSPFLHGIVLRKNSSSKKPTNGTGSTLRAQREPNSAQSVLIPLPRCARIACAHLAEERGALLLHTLSSVEVQSGRPGLPIPPAGVTGLCLNPLVETPLRLVFVPRLDQFGQRQQLPPRQPHPPRRYACRHIEADRKSTRLKSS